MNSEIVKNFLGRFKSDVPPFLKGKIGRVETQGGGFEIYSKDELRKYFFKSFPDTNPPELRIKLFGRMGGAWGLMMEVVEFSADENKEYSVIVEALIEKGDCKDGADADAADFSFTTLNAGRRERTQKSFYFSEETEEGKSEMVKRILFSYKQLPDQIDVVATVNRFLENLVQGDFSDPEFVLPGSAADLELLDSGMENFVGEVCEE